MLRGGGCPLFPVPSGIQICCGKTQAVSPRSCSPAACFSNDPASRSIPMTRHPIRALVLTAFGLAGLSLTFAVRAEQDLTKAKWVKSTAYVVPKETATEGEGYFSIIEGHNRRLYIGTHANGVNSWLVEFDPAAEKMKVVVDAHKAIGKDLRGFGSQAKIHTRNNVGASGKIYFGTKQGYPGKN